MDKYHRTDPPTRLKSEVLAENDRKEKASRSSICSACPYCNLVHEGDHELCATDSHLRCRCGGYLSENPHPKAGKPEFLLEVGAMHECIPCLVKARNTAQQKLRKITHIIQPNA